MVSIISPSSDCADSRRWRGTPPTSRATRASNGAGRFGKGLDAGGPDRFWDDPGAYWSDPRYMWDGSRVLPDLRPLWPPFGVLRRVGSPPLVQAGAGAPPRA
jgi:hypothetical protein